jgi:hypothetical protein
MTSGFETAPSDFASRCNSCGMPLDSVSDHALGDAAIPYCGHCTTEDGSLQPREERLERFTRWAMQVGGLDRAAARDQAQAYMATMPAWRDPTVR